MEALAAAGASAGLRQRAQMGVRRRRADEERTRLRETPPLDAGRLARRRRGGRVR